MRVNVEQGIVDLQFAMVVNQAPFSEIVHEQIHSFGDRVILSAVPGMVTPGRSGTCVGSKFRSAIFAVLAMRGFAISFLTSARVPLPDSLCALLRAINLLCHRSAGGEVAFRSDVKIGSVSANAVPTCEAVASST